MLDTQTWPESDLRSSSSLIRSAFYFKLSQNKLRKKLVCQPNGLKTHLLLAYLFFNYNYEATLPSKHPGHTAQPPLEHCCGEGGIPLTQLQPLVPITAKSTKQRGKNVHNCPTTSLQGSTLMRTRGNLYFKDVITPNQKIIFALMWQSLVLSVIRIHCLYPAQFSKLRAVAVPETPWQHLLPGLIATRVTTTAQWPPQSSDHHNPVPCLDYDEVQETETTNLLTGANSTDRKSVV